MNEDMRTRALAAHDAHLALLELKKLVDDVTQATHAAELEAVYLTVSARQSDDIRMTLKVIMDRMASPNFETKLSQIREKLETAAS
jgi:hypothetical protein